MVPEKRSSDKGGNETQFRLQLAEYKQGDERPNVVVTVIGANAKPIHTAQVDEQGNVSLPADALKAARQILVGPNTESQEYTLRYRPEQFQQLIRDGVLNVAPGIWKNWYYFLHCVTGTVRLCRPRPWWLAELTQLATSPKFSVERSVSLAGRAVSTKSISQARPPVTVAKSIPELLRWPFRCQVICNGVVEVYRRTCCCEPWIIEDPRLAELIRELETIIQGIPIPIPQPNPPDPAPFLEQTFFREGALDELALNAQHDLAAIRSLPQAEVVDYINARPYLLCRRYSCGTPQKVAEGSIQPDGRFNICWLDFRRIQSAFCHDEYAYIVKQRWGTLTFTVYNGVAANKWFNQNDDATLVSYSPFAYGCRDNGEPGTGAYVYLEYIGDTEAWNLKTPDAVGWNQVAAPAYNDGLAFPAPTPAASVGTLLNRNWGGTLGLTYKFSEDMRNAPVAAKYYRISITDPDSITVSNPTGVPHPLIAGLSWLKNVGPSDVVPVVLGPFSQGGQDNLFVIPYDADGDWIDNQHHAFVDTTDPLWRDPTKRHLVTLEVFDKDGKLLRPTGTAATGRAGLIELEVPFHFQRWFQQTGTARQDVPFAALTHLFWWDNRDQQHNPIDDQGLTAKIEELELNGFPFTEECQFLDGKPTSTFGIGYRAYHPNEMFQYYHSITWHRGLGTGSGTLLPSASDNVGVPPSAPGNSPTDTFSHMLDLAGDPTRTKCAFTVFLDVYSKTFNGVDPSAPHQEDTAAFVLEIG